jgi:thioredoxin-dependent peroxiredoxin
MFTAFITLLITLMVQPGDQAPAFSALSTDGTVISLSDFIGKQNVVLYFYPEDMTGGCTKQAQCFRDDMPKYKAANTVVLGVSLDDQEKHKQFTEKENLNFPLLVDKDGVISKAYGVPLHDGLYPSRWSFLINKEGKIVKKYEKVDPRTNSADLLKDIEEISSH